MFKIEDNSIILTKGDTFIADLTIYDDNGAEYVPQLGDSIVFALKRTPQDRKPYILKDIDINTRKITIYPDDTKNLGFDTYIYEIKLISDNGMVETFIAQGSFKIATEVHS